MHQLHVSLFNFSQDSHGIPAVIRSRQLANSLDDTDKRDCVICAAGGPYSESTIGLTWVALADYCCASFCECPGRVSHYVKRRQIEMPIEMTASETSKLREFRPVCLKQPRPKLAIVSTLHPLPSGFLMSCQVMVSIGSPWRRLTDRVAKASQS